MKKIDAITMQRFLVTLGVLITANLSLPAVTLPTINPTQFLITDYGASTASPDNTKAISDAIAAARANKGGTVVFPAGTFLSGPISIPSSSYPLNLYLCEGDTLRMLPYGTYPGAPTTYKDFNFIYIQNCYDVAITGKGVIEGDGAAWWAAYNSGKISSRPAMVRFKACHRVLVDSITLRNAPNVHLTMGQSSTMGDNATISNITVYADVPSPNTDCIDTWWWDGINIVNCNLSGGDDNIAMDSYTKNITVKHCIFGRGIVGGASTGHGCSIGSYTIAVQNVTVDSCSFNGTDYGIRIKSDRDRGGNGANAVQNLSYSNITMTNINKIAIYMTCYYNSSDPTGNANVASATVTSTTPQYQNITFRNITASTISTSSSSVRVMSLFGLPEMPISNVVFDDVQLNSLSTSTSSSVYVSNVNGLSFNCSNITRNGNPYTSNPYAFMQNNNYPFHSTITGIDINTGKSTNCETGIPSVPVGSVFCYPNPATNQVLIVSENPIDRVTLFSLTGSTVKSISGGDATQLPIDISDMPEGYYFAKVVGTNHEATTLKILKNK